MSNADTDLERLSQAAAVQWGGFTSAEVLAAIQVLAQATPRLRADVTACAVGPDCPVCTGTLPASPLLADDEDTP